MRVDFEPIVLQARVFTEEGASAAKRSTYVGAFNVTLNGDTAYVSLALGYWSREVRKALEKHLVEMGITRLEFERHGEIRTRRLRKTG